MNVKKQIALHALLAMGAMAGAGMGASPVYSSEPDRRTPWQKWSDGFKVLGKGQYLHSGSTLRIRHLSPTIRGKQQIKAAKRSRREGLSATVTSIAENSQLNGEMK